jgi:general secretion pathway protein K
LERLFAVLGLPTTSLDTLSQGLISAQQGKSAAPVMPQFLAQLSWLGLNRQQLALLAPHVTLLPQTTQLNVNTASALALYAAIPPLSLSKAQDLVRQRQTSHWSSVSTFLQSAGLQGVNFDSSALSTQTNYFEVQGHLQIDDQIWHQRCVLWRSGGNVTTQWCERGQWAYTTP